MSDGNASDDSLHSGSSTLGARATALASSAAPVAPPAAHTAFNVYSKPTATAPAPAPASAPASADTDASATGEEVGDRVVNETEELYSPYVPQCPGPTHPSELVSTSTQKFATPNINPDLLHPKIASNMELSAAQRDVVALAQHRADQGLGFLIGDGTGVGKGRELCAVMLQHNHNHPTCGRYIFVSASPQLENDLRRDLSAIGWPLKGKRGIPLHTLNEKGANQLKANDPIPWARAIIFLTYDMLKVEASKPGAAKHQRSRLDQILEWANRGSNFSGVIAFDECHKAKEGKTKNSKTVIKLQEQLPGAQVVYASATAMSSVAHCVALTRLGLWGPDTPYATFADFQKKWKNSTRSGLEVVSAELSAQGAYIQRRLSFAGTEFTTSIAQFTPEQQELHQRLCEWWVRLYRIPDVLSGGKNKSQYWGAHLRFFRGLLMAFRVKYVAQRAKEHLDADGAVVVSLLSTGEAAAKRALAADEDLGESGLVALKGELKRVIDMANDSVTHVPPALKALDDERAAFGLPPSPLDLLIAELSDLGYGDVIELTGRKEGIYRSAEGHWQSEKRKLSNADGCVRFQKGAARIAVISNASSTGISLHNTTGGPDRRRKQLMLELPWDAQTGIQQLGRTHRADQHNAPIYELVASNLDAEKRFAATIARRAADLGAATTGDRRGAKQEEAFGADILVGSDSSRGYQLFYHALAGPDWPQWCERKGDWAVAKQDISRIVQYLNMKPDPSVTTPGRQLLGRIMGIPLEGSNMCFHLYYSACVEASLERAKREADVGVEDILVGPSERSRIDAVTPNGALTIATDIGISWDQVNERASAWQETGGRWRFCSRWDTGYNRRWTVLAQLQGPRVEFWRPNGRRGFTALDSFRTGPARYEAVKDVAQAKKYWEEEYELSLKRCSHGPNCKDRFCNVGKRHSISTVVRMPGALNVLSDYDGSRQILRFCEKCADGTTKQCVAVRLGYQARPDKVESRLATETSRQQTLASASAVNRQALIDAAAQRSAASSSSDTAAADDSDDDEEEEGSGSSSEDSDSGGDSDSDSESGDAPPPSSRAVGKRKAPHRAAASGVADAAAKALMESDSEDEPTYGEGRALPGKKRARLSTKRADDESEEEEGEDDESESEEAEGLAFADEA